MHRQDGLTLIELIITVAIIGILAAIAYPNYTGYVLRANRNVAKTTLMEVHSRQDSYFSDRKRYASSLAALSYPGNPFYISATGDTSSTSNANTIYEISIGSLSPTTNPTRYTLTATPKNQQANDSQCANLTLRSTGKKSASGANGVDCWR